MTSAVKWLSLLVLLNVVACTKPLPEAVGNSQVLFVCEHGNVKSLMAASYFNALAEERGLPFRAASRGIVPDSTTVPAAIASALRADGFDVSDFSPAAVSQSDIEQAARVVAISTQPPSRLDISRVRLEQWNDVPPASTNYPAARHALQAHIEQLMDELATSQAR